MLTLDGAQGEGGGQILRSALSLSMCTGQPFRIERIRAGRSRPGLMPQHLAAVLAAAEVSSAEITSAEVGSRTLTFRPGPVRGGEYRFSTGSAGSATLVFQTVLPALLQARVQARVTLQGGTHNPLAPPYPFLERTYVPVLRRMGARIGLTLVRHGFHPAGGGEFVAEIESGGLLGSVDLTERGEPGAGHAESLIAGLPVEVAKRELAAVARAFGWPGERLHTRSVPRNEGPGNALIITLPHANVTEVFSAFGARGVPAEAVAQQAIAEARTYLESGGAVCAHLADQLLMPMALAGGGTFTTGTATLHTHTNAEVIGRFLPVRIEISASGRNACRVTVRQH